MVGCVWWMVAISFNLLNTWTQFAFVWFAFIILRGPVTKFSSTSATCFLQINTRTHCSSIKFKWTLREVLRQTWAVLLSHSLTLSWPAIDRVTSLHERRLLISGKFALRFALRLHLNNDLAERKRKCNFSNENGRQWSDTKKLHNYVVTFSCRSLSDCLTLRLSLDFASM